MRVGVDLDNCVYPFTSVFWNACGLPDVPPTCWNFYEDNGLSLTEFLDLFVKGVDAGVIFRTGAPFPDSLEALHALKASGHTIHLVTDRFVGQRSYINTAEWLAEYGIPHDTLTFARDKTIICADAFIDDKPEHVDALRAIGCQAYLLDCGRSDQVGQPWLIPDWKTFVEQVG